MKVRPYHLLKVPTSQGYVLVRFRMQVSADRLCMSVPIVDVVPFVSVVSRGKEACKYW